MTRIAITGHRGLSPEVTRLVDTAIRRELARFAGNGTLIGLSCLADGADQVFARAVLDAGGALEVIIPAARYRDGLPEDCHAVYDELLVTAGVVCRLDHVESTPEAHMDASTAMLERADHVLAVWDGLPARGYGGTADVVNYARRRNIPVTVIWPEGATRD